MYTPKFTYTDKLVQNLIKLEQNRIEITNTDLAYNTRFKLGSELRAKDIFHLATMLGLEITIREAEKLANNQRIDEIDEIRGIILRNYNNVLDFNRSNIADTYSEFDQPVMLHLTKLMLSQWRETWEASFRSFRAKIDDRWDNFVELRDRDIMENDIEKEINELVEWYKFSSSTITPIVRIAISIYRMIEIIPFNAGNKFIIAAILDYMLLKNGLSSKSYTSTMEIISANDSKLHKTFMAAKQSNDLSIWIDGFASILNSSLIDSREELGKFISQEEKSKQQPFLNLNKRQLKVLKYLQNVPTIKREDYCHMMEVSTMTAFRDLNELVRKKLIKIDGKGRGTKYKLASM